MNHEENLVKFCPNIFKVMGRTFASIHGHPPPPPSRTLKLSFNMDDCDMFTEILLRLPAKSLIRFKSVCKNWLSLISSDYFCHQHTLRCPKLQQSLILQYANGSRWGSYQDPNYYYWKPTLSMNGGENAMIPYTLSRSYFPSTFSHPHDYEILQSCNGLLLLKNWNIHRVYNPTTRLSKNIKIPTCNGKLKAISLAFDPSESPHYKVVCIMCSSKRDDFTYRVEVYDSERRSWKPSLEPFTLPPGSGFGSFVYEAQYYNNAIFWWLSRCSTGYYCFDIATNEMKAFSFPQSDLQKSQDSHLQELDGNLYYVTLSFRSHELSVEVWELVVGGDVNLPPKWELKHHRVFITHDREGVCKYARLMGDSDGNLVVLVYYWRLGKMIAYGFLDKSDEELVDFKARYGQCVKVYEFGETLAVV